MRDSEPTFLELGRNELCWCGSGVKYKQCHARERYERELAGLRPKELARAIQEHVDAGWRLESRSDDRAVVSRRRFHLIAERKLLEVSKTARVSAERL